MSKRVLHVVSNVAHYADPSEPTGLWLSELTHAWDVFAAKGFEQRIASPKGGVLPMKRRGALYEKAFLPFVSNVVVAGRLVTGQNPWSAKATAQKVAALL
ncbi:MAG: hypothetical protein AB7G13_18720 [Lautropia sp.]